MNNETFGERLRKYRKKAGLTQEKLAELAEVAVTSVRRWEWGEQLPNIAKLKLIAAALGIPESNLTTDPPPECWELKIKISDNKERDFIDMTKDMPCISNMIINPNGATLELGGSWKIFASEAKFNEFVQQLIDARESILDIKKALRY